MFLLFYVRCIYQNFKDGKFPVSQSFRVCLTDSYFTDTRLTVTLTQCTITLDVSRWFHRRISAD